MAGGDNQKQQDLHSSTRGCFSSLTGTSVSSVEHSHQIDSSSVDDDAAHARDNPPATVYWVVTSLFVRKETQGEVQMAGVCHHLIEELLVDTFTPLSTTVVAYQECFLFRVR